MISGQKRVEMRADEFEAVDRLLAQRKLIHFVRQAWHVIEPSEFIEGPHVTAVCDCLQAVTEGRIKKLLVNIPPRMTKSLLLAFWFAWSWINKPSSRWMFFSYAHRLATRDSLKCRRIVDSSWYQSRWGARFYLLDDQNTKERFDNSRTGFRLASSPSGLAVGEGGDFIVVDDAHKTTDVDSDARRKFVIDWYAGTAMTRGNDAAKTGRVILGQRQHEDDLYNWARDQGDWVELVLPMRYEKETHCKIEIDGKPFFEDWRTKEGELLCPARIGEEAANELERSVGPYWWSGQFQQRPSPAAGEMFKRADFRWFKILPLPATIENNPEDRSAQLNFIFELIDGPKKRRRYYAWQCSWFQIADTSEGEDDPDGAFTVNGTYVVTPANDLIVWDVDRDKIGFSGQYEWLISNRSRYDGYLEFQAVEKASTGAALISYAESQGCPFEILETGGMSKIQRARSSATLYHAHKIFHRMPSQGGDYVGFYEDEHIKFPKGKFKDCVDIGAYAAMILSGRFANLPMVRTIDLGSDEAKAAHDEYQKALDAIPTPEDDSDLDDFLFDETGEEIEEDENERG